MEGKKVLLVDADPQGSLSISLGFPQPDKIPTTIATVMVITNTPIEFREGLSILAVGILQLDYYKYTWSLGVWLPRVPPFFQAIASPMPKLAQGWLWKEKRFCL